MCAAKFAYWKTALTINTTCKMVPLIFILLDVNVCHLVFISGEFFEIGSNWLVYYFWC